MPALEARVLIGHALAVDRAWLAAHATDALDPQAAKRTADLLSRRARGEPVAYLTGEREFYGRAFHVTPAVLIPRPETELLVETALALAPRGARVLDLGTGSGAIAVTLACERPDLQVTACELSNGALALARANAERLGARVAFVESDWFAGVSGAFGLIVSNPPYLATGDAHLAQGDLRFEPQGALVAGPHGLEAVEAIAREARAHLVPGGHLLIEHGYDQGERSVDCLRGLGYRDVIDHRDLAGLPRLVQGRFDPGEAGG